MKRRPSHTRFLEIEPHYQQQFSVISRTPIFGEGCYFTSVSETAYSKPTMWWANREQTAWIRNKDVDSYEIRTFKFCLTWTAPYWFDHENQWVHVLQISSCSCTLIYPIYFVWEIKRTKIKRLIIIRVKNSRQVYLIFLSVNEYDD